MDLPRRRFKFSCRDRYAKILRQVTRRGRTGREKGEVHRQGPVLWPLGSLTDLSSSSPSASPSAPLRDPLSFSRRGFASRRFRAQIARREHGRIADPLPDLPLRRESATKIGSRLTRRLRERTTSLVDMRIYVRETHATMARLSLERRPGQLLPFQEATRARVVGSR